jgi:hypothetical protein
MATRTILPSRQFLSSPEERSDVPSYFRTPGKVSEEYRCLFK